MYPEVQGGKREKRDGNLYISSSLYIFGFNLPVHVHVQMECNSDGVTADKKHETPRPDMNQSIHTDNPTTADMK